MEPLLQRGPARYGTSTPGTRTGDIAFGKPAVGTKAMADAVIAAL